MMESTGTDDVQARIADSIATHWEMHAAGEPATLIAVAGAGGRA